MGGQNSDQLIEYVRSYDPRSWTCLHIQEGALNCNNVTVQNNDIGPCGSDNFQEWADGVSMSCRNSIVRNNMIQGATDGGIVVFGSPGTQVYNNTIWILNVSVNQHPQADKAADGETSKHFLAASIWLILIPLVVTILAPLFEIIPFSGALRQIRKRLVTPKGTTLRTLSLSTSSVVEADFRLSLIMYTELASLSVHVLGSVTGLAAVSPSQELSPTMFSVALLAMLLPSHLRTTSRLRTTVYLGTHPSLVLAVRTAAPVIQYQYQRHLLWIPTLQKAFPSNQTFRG